MALEIDRSAGAWTGGALGLAGGVLAGRAIAASSFTEDVVSTGGALAGASQSKLPAVPSFFTGLAARRTAREFIAQNPKLNDLPMPVKNVLVDGIATRVGASLNDPNQALDVLDSAAGFAAKKLAPEHHAQITGALGAVRDQGVRTVNATLGANSARYLSRIAIPMTAGIALAGVGALVGAALLPKLPGIGMPNISMPDLPGGESKPEREPASEPAAPARERNFTTHADDFSSNDAIIGEVIGQSEYFSNKANITVESVRDKDFGSKAGAVEFVGDHARSFGNGGALVHRSFDDPQRWSVSTTSRGAQYATTFTEVDATGEPIKTDSLFFRNVYGSSLPSTP